ncbi:MAG: hypothetical protein GX797_09710 [Chloroflexi bacterium]|jgi:hypothetical protein|nr:hypothetical protein [Chloroflexota bacterium]
MKRKFVHSFLIIAIFTLLLASTSGLNVRAQDIPPAGDLTNITRSREQALPSDDGEPFVPDSVSPDSFFPTTDNLLTTSLSEGFDDISLLPGKGWVIINKSEPVGVIDWFQGNAGVFAAHSGAENSYIGTNYNSVTGSNTISNWLLTPELWLVNGDQFTFWTRRPNTIIYPDRLQVRLSTNGGSDYVGDSPTSVGDFDALLLDINPSYADDGYPVVWTQYNITLTGLSSPTRGRIAFRYFVENGGPDGTRSNYIGIDTVSSTSAMVAYQYLPVTFKP